MAGTMSRPASSESTGSLALAPRRHELRELIALAPRRHEPRKSIALAPRSHEPRKSIALAPRSGERERERGGRFSKLRAPLSRRADAPTSPRKRGEVKSRDRRWSGEKARGVGPAFLLASALILLGCARRTEFIGNLVDAGAPIGDGDATGDASDPLAAFCLAADPPPPATLEPVWTCPTVAPHCWRDPSPAVDPALFAAAVPAASGAPVLVYPPAGSFHPINLPRITVQWMRVTGATQRAFHLRIRSLTKASNSYDFFVPEQAPMGVPATSPLEAMVFPIPERFWRRIGSDNAGSDVQITVAGYDATTNQVATSAPVAIHFSAAAVEGGLFFLATEPQSTVWRHLFGSTAAQPLVPIPVAGVADLNCAGCHSLSADAQQIAFSATYAGDLTVASTSNLAQPSVKPSTAPDISNAVAPALSRDGRLIFARKVDGSVWLLDPQGTMVDMKLLAEMEGRIDYPEWSPTGLELVATRAQGAVQPVDTSAANDGTLVIIPIPSGAGGARSIGKPIVLATADVAHTYGNPSFSPDGKWIVVVARPAGTSSHANPSTRLRLIRRDQPSEVHDLLAATGDIDTASTYPKFAPVAQNKCQTFFLAFQSRRDYGLVRVTSLAIKEWPQLWMTAIDLTRLPSADPSSPPLWLPFQDIGNKNLLPTWSARIACDSTHPCAAGEACADGRCLVMPN